MELIVLIAMFFLPSLIALVRSHHNAFAIFLTNFLLGWTLIGWIIALIWSTTSTRQRVAA
ncbi:superinfection immunity protein [Hyphobacterium sp.]|uniref:superinfection immunity protein n=1 Tax=Hyphobacterium sp. TaxID=2004662 RepID=UPI003BADA2B8